jgi:hypothetical protein
MFFGLDQLRPKVLLRRATERSRREISMRRWKSLKFSWASVVTACVIIADDTALEVMITVLEVMYPSLIVGLRGQSVGTKIRILVVTDLCLRPYGHRLVLLLLS